MRSTTLDSVLLTAVAFAVYLACGQATFHETDGHFILWRHLQGEVRYTFHFGYMPLHELWQWLLAPFGVTPFVAARSLSALGAALGVLATHRLALRLGHERTRAAFAAALFASAPPVVFFATVIEFHTPFAAATVLALLVAEGFAARPGVARAVAAGSASAVTFLLHSSGIFLAGLTLPWFLGARVDRGAGLRRREFGLAALAGLVHGLVIWGLVLGFVHGLGFGPFPPEYDRNKAAGLSLASLLQLPEVAWQEWLGACLPLSLVAFMLPLEARSRGRALAAWAGIVSFLALSLILLLARPERGAYLLPCVAPLAVLAPFAFYRGVLGLLLVASLWMSVVQQLDHDRRGPALREFAAGLRELERERPIVLLIATPDELGAVLQNWPALFEQHRMVLLTDLAARPPSTLPDLPASLAAIARQVWAEGRQLLLGGDGLRYLVADAVKMPSGELLERALESGFRHEPVQVRGFAGFRLLPRN